jgi:hypothetical protein
MATGQGIIIFNFGSAPGTNTVDTVVTDAGVTTGAKIEIYLMGTDSTASHNAVEHQMLPMLGFSVQCVAINTGVGFTARAMCQSRISGTFQARYVWAD